jgi:hypothetical protein
LLQQPQDAGDPLRGSSDEFLNILISRWGNRVAPLPNYAAVEQTSRLPDIQPQATLLERRRESAVRSRRTVALVAVPDRELMYPLMTLALISVTRSAPKIHVINIRDEARYYLTLEEATQLAAWLTERTSTRRQCKRSSKGKGPAKG